VRASTEPFADLHEVRISGTTKARYGVWAYVDPIKMNPTWVSHHIGTSPLEYLGLPEQYGELLQAHFQEYMKAFRTNLLNRRVGWVAFDTGLWKNLALNSVEASRKSHSLGASVINVDVTFTKDNVLVGAHNEHAFSSLPATDFQSPVSSITAIEATKMLNPCIQEKAYRRWFYDNIYQSQEDFACNNTPLDRADDFIRQFPDTEIIFDLKGSTEQLQTQGALAVANMIEGASLKSRNLVAVRFFSVSESVLAAEILPDVALQEIVVAKHLRIYVNVPSPVACLQIMSWAKSHTLPLNLAGCFVIMNHARLSESWNSFRKKHNVPFTIPTSSASPSPAIKMICDVPRKQKFPDTSLWPDGLTSCMLNGFDFVHHPFALGGEGAAGSNAFASFYSPATHSTFVGIIESRLGDYRRLRAHWHAGKPPVGGRDYISRWGIGSAYHMPFNPHNCLLNGTKSFSNSPEITPILHSFRCVSKLLVVMLFLRLEEHGLIQLDQKPIGKPFSWQQIFSNNALANTTDGFEYSNAMWSLVPDAIAAASHMHFTDAIRYYILDPMGLAGHFDTETSFPPYAARGYVGPCNDLSVIGSTLSNLGVSPVTGKQIISSSNTYRMLGDTVSPNTIGRSNFRKNKVTESMSRFHTGRADGHKDFPYGVVDGYGLGVWRVKGWRSHAQDAPARGWLSLGSSENLLYFDMTGIVVSMCADTRQEGYELTGPFAHVVRDIGSHVLQSLR